MGKKWIFLLAMLLVAALFVVGCSDDDDDVSGDITSPVTPATFTNGEIYTYSDNYLYFYVYTYVYGGGYPEVDSILVDTMPFNVESGYYWGYADPYWYAYYSGPNDYYTYQSGDNVTVLMYGSGRSSSCDISILDYDDDAADIISPLNNSIVITGESVEIVWNEVENAEYYALYAELHYDSSGTMTIEHLYTYTYDTTYTMPEQFTNADADYFYFYVVPTCGPDPGNYEGNWTGTFTTGVFYSCSEVDNIYLIVRTPPPAKANSIPREDITAPEINSREIIRGVYGLNR